MTEEAKDDFRFPFLVFTWHETMENTGIYIQEVPEG